MGERRREGVNEVGGEVNKGQSVLGYRPGLMVMN